MKHNAYRFLAGVGLILACVACRSENSTPTDPIDTTSPSVSLTASETVVTQDGDLTLVATATDNVGVASVEFLQGGTSLGSVTTAPYEWNVPVTLADNGDHSFSARARDEAGNQSVSSAIDVTVAIPDLPQSEDFDDNQLNLLHWEVVERGGGIVREVDSRLELSLPAVLTDPNPWAGVDARCMLLGDFDVQVEYELLDWPSQSGVRSALGSSSGSSGRVSFAAGDFNGQESYVSDFSPIGGDIVILPTADNTGSLRLTRSGDAFTSYHWDGSAWVVMQTRTVTTAEMSIVLAMWTHQPLFVGQDVRMAFDNFLINVGQKGTCT